ncbi:MAG TPA: hypothetical protein VIL74_14115 [Pyrinomonadaceae bacterium]
MKRAENEIFVSNGRSKKKSPAGFLPKHIFAREKIGFPKSVARFVLYTLPAAQTAIEKRP